LFFDVGAFGFSHLTRMNLLHFLEELKLLSDVRDRAFTRTGRHLRPFRVSLRQ
jgi:hypothetical protein